MLPSTMPLVVSCKAFTPWGEGGTKCRMRGE